VTLITIRRNYMKATEFILDTVNNISSWSNVSTNMTLVLRTNYIVDTSSSSLTLTIPTAENMGDQIILKDKDNNFSTNNVIINSADKIQGSTNSVTLSTDGSTIVLIYVDSDYGWQVIDTKADAIKNIEIDDSNLADGAIIKYNETLNRFEYQQNLQTSTAPVLSGDSNATELTDIDITITNYDPTTTYTVDVPVGSTIRSGAVITWSLPDVGEDWTYQIAVTGKEVGKSPNTTGHNVTIADIPNLIGPDANEEANIVSINIANYHSTYTYAVSADKGSTNRTDGTVFWTLPEVTDDEVGTLLVTSKGPGEQTQNTYQITIKDSASVSGPNTELEGLIATITIDDYDAVKYTYDVAVTGGNASRTDDSIEWTLPEVASDTNHTLTVTQHETGFDDIETDHVILVENVPVVPDTAMVVEGAGFNDFIEEGENYEIGSVNATNDNAWVMTVPEYQDNGEEDFTQTEPKLDVTTKEFDVKTGSTTSSLILDGESDGIDDFLVKYSSNDLVTMDGNVSSQSNELTDPSFGSEQIFNSGTTHFISAVALDSTHICVSYRDTDNSQYGTSIIGTISGNSISWGMVLV